MKRIGLFEGAGGLQDQRILAPASGDLQAIRAILA